MLQLDGGDATQWVICYWTDFYDQNGNVIEVVFHGCYPL